MVPAPGLCFLSGVSRPRISHNLQVMRELCLKRMGALLKGMLANFWRGCPQMEPFLFQGGLCFPGKLGSNWEVPCLKRWVFVSPVSYPNLSLPWGSAFLHADGWVGSDGQASSAS